MVHPGDRHARQCTDRGVLDGRNWARTSDLRLVEAALSQLSYTPGKRKGSALYLPDAGYATGAVGACTAAGSCGRVPLARNVILKVSRLSYRGCQPAVDFSFSVETTQGNRVNAVLPAGASVRGTCRPHNSPLSRFMFLSETRRVFFPRSSATRDAVTTPSPARLKAPACLPSSSAIKADTTSSSWTNWYSWSTPSTSGMNGLFSKARTK